MIEVMPFYGQIYLGKQGENLARKICFDEISEWKKIFGEGRFELLHQRYGDSAPYPVLIENQDNKVYWKVTLSDTAIAGEGKCELHYIVDDVIVKSKIWTTSVIESLGEGDEEPPEAHRAWVDEVLNAAERAEEAAERAESAGGSGEVVTDEQIQEAVNKYLQDNPVSVEESDPTVPSWAKESKKPKYSADEVGAYSKSEVDLKMKDVNGHIDSLMTENQTLTTTVEGLQKQLTEEAHFRGYLSTNAKIQALEATPNDFAYSAESGTKWVYDAVDGWQDTKTPVPDQLTPASEATPLMDGAASVGSEEAYARGDHRHPTDTTRVSVEEFNKLKSDIELVLNELHNYAQALIVGGA